MCIFWGIIDNEEEVERAVMNLLIKEVGDISARFCELFFGTATPQKTSHLASKLGPAEAGLRMRLCSLGTSAASIMARRTSCSGG